MKTQMSSKLTGCIGLAQRAGQLHCGVEKAITAIQKGQSDLILIDQGSSLNTAKRIRDKCDYYQADMIVITEGILDAAIGKSGIMAAAVLKGNFAVMVRKAYLADTDPLE